MALADPHRSPRNRRKRPAGAWPEAATIGFDWSARPVRDRSWQLRDATGEVFRVIGVAEDETERESLLAALHAERSRLRAIFEAAPIGVVFAVVHFRRITEGYHRADGFRDWVRHGAARRGQRA